MTTKKETFIGRMEEELKELNTKIQELKEFLNTESFAGLPGIEKYDLLEQSQHMENYAWVLQKRIRRLNK